MTIADSFQPYFVYSRRDLFIRNETEKIKICWGKLTQINGLFINGRFVKY